MEKSNIQVEIDYPWINRPFQGESDFSRGNQLFMGKPTLKGEIDISRRNRHFKDIQGGIDYSRRNWLFMDLN